MSTEMVNVPDIGGAEGVEVIEIFVQVGDKIEKEAPLINLESDKATMEVPASSAGVVKALHVKVGDKVSEGSAIVEIEVAEEGETAEAQQAPAPAKEAPVKESTTTEIVNVPDIGGAEGVEVIEIFVQVGDKIEKEAPLINLESDKATMEVPAPSSGVVTALHVNVGDKVSEGSAIVEISGSAQEAPTASTTAPASSEEKPKQPTVSSTTSTAQEPIYASPAVRRLARERSIDLHQITGSGRKGRITKEDLNKQPAAPAASPAMSIPAAPTVDFSQFGEVTQEPLSRINKLSAKNMHRNWVSAPHVTQFDEADITEMEAFRKANKKQAEQQGFKFTPLVFIMKAVVHALKTYPRFNSSLDSSGEMLIMKQYYHLGIAVDTPNGLVVPVIRDVDKKSLFDLAEELAAVSKKARDGKLTARDMQGQCFTISSLGGIGGTAFTPIINLPDVAILGVSKSQIKPVYNGKEFEPRLMLPLSLSYDHRVIDGAVGARFSSFLVQCLSDVRRLLL